MRRVPGRDTGRTSLVLPDVEADSVSELTALVREARKGLKSRVAALESALDDGELHVPLAREIEGATLGESAPLDRSFELVPHFLGDEAGRAVAVLFTRPEMLQAVGEDLHWQTDGGELSYCTLPARVACRMALDVIDGQNVLGLVLDAGHDSELFMTRAELASVVAGQPLPLVGYVRELPPLEGEKVLVAEERATVPDDFRDALERCLSSLPVRGHGVSRTLNPERDLEPHLTLSLHAEPDASKSDITRAVIEAVGELLPPPGYIDIVFAEDEP